MLQASPSPPPQTPHAMTVESCVAGSAAQSFTVESDGSIRHAGSSSGCFDVNNCGKTDGTSVALYECHPAGTSESGYKNQQWKVDPTSKTVVNVNSNTCLTLLPSSGQFVISACKKGDHGQQFEAVGGALKTADGKCVAAVAEPVPKAGHCCRDGWVSQIDSQQDLTLDSLSGPGYWNGKLESIRKYSQVHCLQYTECTLYIVLIFPSSSSFSFFFCVFFVLRGWGCWRCARLYGPTACAYAASHSIRDVFPLLSFPCKC